MTLPFASPVRIDDVQMLEFNEFLRDIAYQAGETIKPYFRSHFQTDNKNPKAYDPVTQADREAEETIRGLIKRRYPDHGIYGEEYGFEPGTSGLTWVIDPIDGTRSFIAGMWHWGSLIALFNGESAVLGCIYQPILDELFIGNPKGSTLFKQNQSIELKTRSQTRLGQAIVCSTHPDIIPDDAGKKAFQDLLAATRMSIYGGDCYHYALLAMGLVDLCVEGLLKPYDIQAVVPVVEGAGGVVTTWSGKNPASGGQIVAAASAELHREALAFLSPAAAD